MRSRRRRRSPTVTSPGAGRSTTNVPRASPSAIASAGLGPDSKTALYMYNCNEYLEAEFGTFKTRGVSINVNYRYLDEELRYLLDNSDSEALFFHSSLADRVARVVDGLPKLKLLVEVDDGGETGQVPGAVPYEDLLASHAPMERIERGVDDIYMLYTGGTTGMPKGVMYTMAGMTRGLLTAGFPLLGLAAPADAADIAPMVRDAVDRGAGGRLDPVRAADARHGSVDRRPHPVDGRRPRRSRSPIAASIRTRSSPRSSDTASPAMTIVGDSFAKPIVARTRRGQGRRHALRPVVAAHHLLVGRDVDDGGEATADRAHRARHADRRHRFDRGVDGHADLDEGDDRPTPLASSRRRRPRSSPRTTARSRPAPTRSAWWRQAAASPSATSRTPTSRRGRSG